MYIYIYINKNNCLLDMPHQLPKDSMLNDS